MLAIFNETVCSLFWIRGFYHLRRVHILNIVFCPPQKREKIISRLFSEYSIYRHIFAFSLFLLWFYLNNLVLFPLSSYTVISLLLPLLLVIRMRFPEFYALVSGLLKYSLCFIFFPRLLHFYTIQRHIFLSVLAAIFFLSGHGTAINKLNPIKLTHILKLIWKSFGMQHSQN